MRLALAYYAHTGSASALRRKSISMGLGLRAPIAASAAIVFLVRFPYLNSSHNGKWRTCHRVHRPFGILTSLTHKIRWPYRAPI